MFFPLVFYRVARAAIQSSMRSLGTQHFYPVRHKLYALPVSCYFHKWMPRFMAGAAFSALNAPPVLDSPRLPLMLISGKFYTREDVDMSLIAPIREVKDHFHNMPMSS